MRKITVLAALPLVLEEDADKVRLVVAGDGPTTRPEVSSQETWYSSRATGMIAPGETAFVGKVAPISSSRHQPVRPCTDLSEASPAVLRLLLMEILIWIM